MLLSGTTAAPRSVNCLCMGTAVHHKQQKALGAVANGSVHFRGAGKPGTSRVWSIQGLDQAFPVENEPFPAPLPATSHFTYKQRHTCRHLCTHPAGCAFLQWN